MIGANCAGELKVGKAEPPSKNIRQEEVASEC